MNRYNPYTVPDGFFDSLCSEALKRRNTYRRRLSLAVGAVSLAIILIMTPLVIDYNKTEEYDTVAANVDRLADLYENDLFLYVNFE